MMKSSQPQVIKLRFSFACPAGTLRGQHFAFLPFASPTVNKRPFCLCVHADGSFLYIFANMQLEPLHIKDFAYSIQGLECNKMYFMSEWWSVGELHAHKAC